MSLLKCGGIRPKLSTFVWVKNVIGMKSERAGVCVRQVGWAFLELISENPLRKGVFAVQE